MKKQVKFFFYDSYRLGYNTYELFKYLFNYGFNCHLVSWAQSYSLEEMKDMDNSTDIWVTVPSAVHILHNDYKIPLEKCVAIAFSTADLQSAKDEYINNLYGFGVTSNLIKEYSSLKRTPTLCPIGINYPFFHSNPREKLVNIGYLKSDDSTNRGHLVQKCAQILNLPLVTFDAINYNYVGYPAFYRTISCIITANRRNTDNLSIMEAAASGVLVIGTVEPTSNIIEEVGGIVVDIDEKLFISETVDIIGDFQREQGIYRERCMQIRNKSKKYDWSNVIESWANILDEKHTIL